MYTHAPESANSHLKCQVPIDRLRSQPVWGDDRHMARNFSEVLKYHMQKHGTKIAELAQGSGVSENVIKKLRTTHTSTVAENALAIARYYGMPLEQFMRCDDIATDRDVLANALDLLDDDQLLSVKALIDGLARQPVK